MLVEKEEIQDAVENNETKTISRQSSAASLRKSSSSLDSSNSEKKRSITDGNNEGANGKDEILKELEASSRGKISGSMLFNYLRAAKRPCTLTFLVVSFLLTQILCSVADIWISYW